MEEIGGALTENVISKYCVPDYIMDKDSVFMSSLILFVQEIQIQNKNSGTLQ